MNQNSQDLRSVCVFDIEQIVQESCVKNVSSVNFELSSSVPIDNVLSVAQIAMKSQNTDGEENDLKELRSCVSVNDELNIESNSELNIDIDELLSESEANMVRSVIEKNYLNKPKVEVDE